MKIEAVRRILRPENFRYSATTRNGLANVAGPKISERPGSDIPLPGFSFFGESGDGAQCGSLRLSAVNVTVRNRKHVSRGYKDKREIKTDETACFELRGGQNETENAGKRTRFPVSKSERVANFGWRRCKVESERVATSGFLSPEAKAKRGGNEATGWTTVPSIQSITGVGFAGLWTRQFQRFLQVSVQTENGSI